MPWAEQGQRDARPTVFVDFERGERRADTSVHGGEGLLERGPALLKQRRELAREWDAHVQNPAQPTRVLLKDVKMMMELLFSDVTVHVDLLSTTKGSRLLPMNALAGLWPGLGEESLLGKPVATRTLPPSQYVLCLTASDPLAIHLAHKVRLFITVVHRITE